MKTTKQKSLWLLIAFVMASAFTFQNVSAQWSIDPAQNTAIVTEINQQNSSKIVSDGNGGAIIAWWNYNLTSGNYDIYAQRINSKGIVQWAADGVGICTDPSMVHVPYICSDEEGGAIIAWFDKRNIKNEVFAQKINQAGIVQWTPNGVSVGTVASHYQQGSPAITADGTGGVIIAWADWRRDEFNDDYLSVRAQRISKSGITMWGVGGVALNTVTLGSTNSNGDPKIISDGNGGAIVAWDKWIGPYPGGNRDVFAQKVNADGSLAWAAEGLTLCSAVKDQNYPYLASDGNGGAIVSWEDYRDGSKNYLYAQNVNSSGLVQWAADGVKVSDVTTNYGKHRLVTDGSGGAIITWPNSAVWAQKINSNGVPQWTSSGSAIMASYNPQVIPDGAGGAFLVCDDNSTKIYAQHVNASGSALWGIYGVTVSYTSGYRYEPKLTTDGHGGIIVCWDDRRNEIVSSTDIYAQQVSPTGALGVTTGVENINNLSKAQLFQNFPNPYAEKTHIDFKVNIREHISIIVCNQLGVKLFTLIDSDVEPGKYSVVFDKELPAGIYFYTLNSGSYTETKLMVKAK